MIKDRKDWFMLFRQYYINMHVVCRFSLKHLEINYFSPSWGLLKSIVRWAGLFSPTKQAPVSCSFQQQENTSEKLTSQEVATDLRILFAGGILRILYC
jgi:hypothetical protein